MGNNITKQILDLDKKPIKDLRELYEKLYFEEAKSTTRCILIRKIAYRLQELEYGFLSEKHAKKLEKLTNDFDKGKLFAGQRYFKPTRGTKIKRIYNGINYEVETVEDGFICGGMKYKSLSALASKITGNKTNGIKFFGVKNGN